MPIEQKEVKFLGCPDAEVGSHVDSQEVSDIYCTVEVNFLGRPAGGVDCMQTCESMDMIENILSSVDVKEKTFCYRSKQLAALHICNLLKLSSN
jgi:hypothetical protein